MKNNYKIFISALFLSPLCFYGQDAKKDTIRNRDIQEVIVSGNTFVQKAKDVPIPVKIIDKKEITKTGTLRLSDILREQTGLVIANDHGTGLQMQGMSSEYTAILLNGEPILGRINGTFNLNRISLSNIKRIEVVKGPSSSLFGSDALAGVINIITEEPMRDQGSLSLRAGSNTTLEFDGNLGIVRGNLSADLSANRYSSEGYGFYNDRYRQTVNPYESYSYAANLKYKISPKLNAELISRYTHDNVIARSKNDAGEKLRGQGRTNDLNIAPRLTWKPNENITSAFRFYFSNYENKTINKKENSGVKISEGFYKEHYYKGENFTDVKISEKFQTTFGVGATLQGVNSSTLYDEKKWVGQYYGLAQIAYKPLENWNILLGARYDHNTAYGSQFNPKLAMDYKVGHWLTLRSSVGRGFKAPDFRQLYTNFTNESVGYSVFGTKEIAGLFDEMMRNGEIADVYITPDKVKELTSESSWAYNFGIELKPYKKLKIGANLFQNNIKNMIGVLTIARKTNDRSIYSYGNLDKIFTQGIETEVSWQFLKNFEFSGGYQYLEAKNQEVLDKIKAGTLRGKNDNNQTIRIKNHNYFGIMGRSKHTFNAKLFYQNSKGTFANLRAIYRGAYGYRDTDFNDIVNNKSELTPGYLVLNASVGQTFAKKYTLQVGVDNIGDFKKPEYYSEFPGRLYWVSLKAEF